MNILVFQLLISFHFGSSSCFFLLLVFSLFSVEICNIYISQNITVHIVGGGGGGEYISIIRSSKEHTLLLSYNVFAKGS